MWRNDWKRSSRFGRWRKLILVGVETWPSCKRLAKKLKGGVIKSRFPTTYKGFSRKERRAPVLAIRSQYDHSTIVHGRKVIPLVLRLTRLRLVR